MVSDFHSRIAWLEKDKNLALLKGIKRGIEKEGLRVDNQGLLSQNPHPSALGSALTHSQITTDYSEALLELITDTHPTISNTLKALTDTHAFVHKHLENEYLWGCSFPCHIAKSKDIPIAQYGHSNIGNMKTLYRKGLDARYGRKMQTIAGIHYNFSLPHNFWEAYQKFQGETLAQQSFISKAYFSLIRNAQRLGWLPVLLFGSSPAMDKSFLSAPSDKLLPLGSSTLMAPEATSLRMSNLGYQNSAQSSLHICYNHLESYIQSLDSAIRTPEAVYEKIGIYDAQGQRQQINTHLLQIENEYYGSIRPKQTTQSGERPSLALARRGVEYVELRSLDLNPFSPIGIDTTTCCFIEVFLLYALLYPSPLLTEKETCNNRQNLEKTAYYGRGKEAIHLLGPNQNPVNIRHWANDILIQMQPIARCLATVYEDPCYIEALELQTQKITDPSLLPASRMLAALEDHADPRTSCIEYIEFALAQARKDKAYFSQYKLTDAYLDSARKKATESITAQSALENSEEISLEAFIENYFSD